MSSEHLMHIGSQEMIIFFYSLGSSKDSSEVNLNLSRVSRQILARQKYYLSFNKILKHLNKNHVLLLKLN